VGSNERCSRRHCSHQLVDHRRARAVDGERAGQLLIGACKAPGCQCAQYVHEGLTTGNNVLPIYGDHGKSASRELLDAPLPVDLNDPMYDRYLIVPR